MPVSVIKRIFSLVLVFVFVFSLAACNDGIDDASTTYSYTPGVTSSGDSDDSAEETTAPQNIVINTDWQKNFTLSYSYYDADNDSGMINIEERRSDSAFTVEYTDTGALLYYAPNEGGGTDYYVIIPGESEQVHSYLADSSFATLSSMFMKLSKVDSTLPRKNNVVYMYEESVAGRPCAKYIQRSYQDGEETGTCYVWIDNEFGFASKCESFSAAGVLTLSWELKNFVSGETTAEDTEVNLADYTFVEEVG